jgi:hypothetical protein
LPESPEERKVVKCAKQMFVVGSVHEVKILECKEGPREFYVKLISHEDLEKWKAFEELLKEAVLSPITIKPSIGSQVIALTNNSNTKKLEVFRGIVEKFEKDLIKIHLVDLGRKIMVKLTHLYTTSQRIMNEPPFAPKFSLHGIQSVKHLDKDELSFYFHYLTHNKSLKLIVRSSNEKGINFKILKK